MRQNFLISGVRRKVFNQAVTNDAARAFSAKLQHNYAILLHGRHANALRTVLHSKIIVAIRMAAAGEATNLALTFVLVFRLSG